MATAREDMDALLDEACELAESLLAKRGEYLPFVFTMNELGGTQLLAIHDEREIQRHVERAASGALPPESGGLRAFAVVRNVTVTDTRTNERSDAILVHLEHEAADPVDFRTFYELSDGSVEMGESKGFRAKPLVVWAQPRPRPEGAPEDET
jgi:hypothetical protein